MTSPEAAALPPIPCPICGVRLMAPASAAVAPARDYADCLRRCDPCGVGFSNGREKPTTVFRDPLHNIPEDVREGALDALAASLNETSRATKVARFGYSSSEDAVTWTVFSFAARSAPATLQEIGRRVFGFPAPPLPTVLLWGAPVPPSESGQALRLRLIEICDSLGEETRGRTEPDVLLDYGAAGLAIIEVKLHSRNEPLAPAQLGKFDRYVGSAEAFTDAARVRASGHYELTRNWRIGCDLAGTRPFRLMNLGPSSLFADDTRLDELQRGLNVSAMRRFHRTTWRELLTCVADTSGVIPTWLSTWLRRRDIVLLLMAA